MDRGLILPNSSISTLLPSGINNPGEPIPNLEVQQEDIEKVIGAVSEEYPWITKDDLITADGNLTPHLASKRNELIENNMGGVFIQLIKNIENEDEQVKWDTLSFNQQALYLATIDFALAVETFSKADGINPIEMKPYGKNSREALYLQTMAEIENIALLLKKRRLELEADLFGQPISFEEKTTKATYSRT